MRTQLSQYCPRFDSTIRPVLAPLVDAVKALDQAPAGTPGTELRAGLTELHHHLQVLCDKVAAQQAYVLIFGPLKSGKSTLMNAVAGAYVSEVSSLPAYPCLVFVSAGRQREYTVTGYDGRTVTFLDPQALHRHIEAAHQELAAAIRAAEQSDLPFDPQEHFPQAIRRVDVRVPGSELASTGAVLVDTPGLYTRMRFGYDRMTRDFRDAAACAIFVVKPDTLFLEQVFAEFHQLLNLFSRIFLVVNVDSGRQDLAPDGRLQPSLEQARPEAILQAFEQLAMSAPLHRAAVEGRVRMYPVDLLHAAAAVLQKRPLEEAGAGFARFRNDLAEFLASADYLAAFVHDSLQRAHLLLTDLAASLASAPVLRLEHTVRELQERLQQVQREAARVADALQQDLAPAFARSERTVDEELERSARDEGLQLLRTLGASIDTWFLSGHSLHWLTDGQWTPLLQEYRREVERAGRRTLEIAVQQPAGGLDLPESFLALCERRGIDVGTVREQALAALPPLPADAEVRVPVDLQSIPVRRGMLDLVAFRSAPKVRTRLFGDALRPDQKIPARDKARHLGEPGRLHLHQCVTQFRSILMPRTVAAARQHLCDTLQRATIRELQRRLQAALPELKAAEARLQRELQHLLDVLGPLRRLEGATAALQQQLAGLAAQFGYALPDLPAREPAVVLEPEARRRQDRQARNPQR